MARVFKEFGNSYHIVRSGIHYFCVVKMIENNVLGVYKKNFCRWSAKILSTDTTVGKLPAAEQ